MTTTTILSDNGVSSGTAGIKTTGGNDGTLQLQTTTAGGAATTAVTIDTSQNVGIGTSSPTQLLHLAKADATTFYQRFQNSVNDLYIGLTSAGNSVVSSNGAYPLVFQTNALERARIDTSGNLLVGTTDPTPYNNNSNTSADNGAVLKAGAIWVASYNNDCGNLNRTGSDGTVLYFARSGAAVGSVSVTTTATSYNTSSDYRLKENIAPMTGALATVAQLKPCTYTWKADGSEGQGFIAHELQEVVPDCVTGEKDAVETYTDENGIEQTRPKYQGIDTSFLVATLTAAIQEQQALINNLTERLSALESK